MSRRGGRSFLGQMRRLSRSSPHETRCAKARWEHQHGRARVRIVPVCAACLSWRVDLPEIRAHATLRDRDKHDAALLLAAAAYARPCERCGARMPFPLSWDIYVAYLGGTLRLR